MLLLIKNEATEGLMLWRFLVEAFGDALHTNNQLINDLLKVEELALKSNNFDFRLCALQSWRCLISCFARNPALISQKKRLKLLMVPFTSSESKTASLARTKIELWWHVLEGLGAKAVDFSGDVTLVCLNFCFGGRNHPRRRLSLFNFHRCSILDWYPFTCPIVRQMGLQAFRSFHQCGRFPQAQRRNLLCLRTRFNQSRRRHQLGSL